MVKIKFRNIDYINILLGFSTLCAAIVSYKTLQEIRSGRDLAIMPDLFISSGTDMKVIADGALLDDIYYSDYRLVQLGDTINEATVPIRNLGFASAKYVEIAWEYDFNYFNDKLDRNFGRNKKWKLEGRKWTNISEIQITNGKDTLTQLSVTDQKVNFLAPALEKNLGNSITIPNDLILVAMYNGELSKKYKRRPIKITPRLNVKYIDLNGKGHKKEFLCTFEMGNYQRDGKISFKFEEINNESLEISREQLGKCNWLDFDGYVLEDQYIRKEEIIDKIQNAKPKVKNICTGKTNNIEKIRFVIVPKDADARVSHGNISFPTDLYTSGTIIYVEELDIVGYNSDEIETGGMFFHVY